MAVCVPNFRPVSFFIWPGDVTQTNKYIHTYTNTYTSEFKNILGGCSPHVDFDNLKMYKASVVSAACAATPIKCYFNSPNMRAHNADGTTRCL